MTLLSLPEEILCNILSGLTSSELIQASTTCQRFRYSAQEILFLRLRDISKLEGHKFIFGCTTPAHRVRHPSPSP
jgi:flagellar motor switch protein FliG